MTNQSINGIKASNTIDSCNLMLFMREFGLLTPKEDIDSVVAKPYVAWRPLYKGQEPPW
jgi:hypothetical protein